MILLNMNLIKLISLTLLTTFTLQAAEPKEPLPPVPYDFLAKKKVKKFINMMVNKNNFKRSYMEEVLGNAMLDQETLDRYVGKYKAGSTNGTWERYKKNVLNDESMALALEFKKNYYTTLQRAEDEYNIDMDYIVGFLGVESKYGTFTGDFRVLDSLATLGFHKNRMHKWFNAELKNLFLLMREENRDIYTQYGSFAGAMGAVQQMPSIQRRFAVDYNGDGIKDPWDLEDSIGIIAKFMHKKGWVKGAVVAASTNFSGTRFKKLKTSHKKKYTMNYLNKHGIKATQPFYESKAYLLKNRNDSNDDIWLGGSNFRVLTRYNNSTSYGMAIHLIAEHVKNFTPQNDNTFVTFQE
ncbi:MAG: Membrane-bound lytic murein transglycosylase B precursor (EC [uncultured Sulfurovum sp.]|uniref:Membrane-bound lytic murein transglycosylase B (EC) n=1 Tax=uncultured Sulfurovum sp. TaxID=269237 RepID=A0A6S6SP58_9BACT|nr:MAG: Membrane-bound lytic murein transglycosylase B precursor (EC [uncultured Sulfurovum sp.]